MAPILLNGWRKGLKTHNIILERISLSSFQPTSGFLVSLWGMVRTCILGRIDGWGDFPSFFIFTSLSFILFQKLMVSDLLVGFDNPRLSLSGSVVI